MKTRMEHDSLGPVEVPADAYWGAQSQRSIQNFKIGQEKMPVQVIKALAYIKKAAANTNHQLGQLDRERCDLISQVCDEILQGDLDDQFPLVVWQTGSGTQTNMNVNEVIANRGNWISQQGILHPNDHVNMSQSSNDTFPTAMHLAILLEVYQSLLPRLTALVAALEALADRYQDVIKIGRTHLQDATPMTFGQEVSGWTFSLDRDRRMLETAMESLLDLALGGTAVGTGLNAPEGYATLVTETLSRYTGLPLQSSMNKFHALSSKDEIVFAHGAVKALAADLMKIGNDLRWLGSGPRCGLGELRLPANEPGSSIMPGKVNPTQIEALTMVAVQVMGNDTTIGLAASQGNFELNVYMPVIIYNFMQSLTLLADAMVSFREKCIEGIEVKRDKMAVNVSRSLMLVTRLSPIIGYEKAAETAQRAYQDNISLKDAVISLGYLTAEAFDAQMNVKDMV